MGSVVHIATGEPFYAPHKETHGRLEDLLSGRSFVQRLAPETMLYLRERVNDALTHKQWGVGSLLSEQKLMEGLVYHHPSHTFDFVGPAAWEMAAYSLLHNHMTPEQAAVFIIAAYFHDTGFQKEGGLYDGNEVLARSNFENYMLRNGKFTYDRPLIHNGGHLIAITDLSLPITGSLDERMIREADTVYAGFIDPQAFIEETQRLYREILNFPQSKHRQSIEKWKGRIKSGEYFGRFKDCVLDMPQFGIDI